MAYWDSRLVHGWFVPAVGAGLKPSRAASGLEDEDDDSHRRGSGG